MDNVRCSCKCTVSSFGIHIPSQLFHFVPTACHFPEFFIDQQSKNMFTHSTGNVMTPVEPFIQYNFTSKNTELRNIIWYDNMTAIFKQTQWNMTALMNIKDSYFFHFFFLVWFSCYKHCDSLDWLIVQLFLLYQNGKSRVEFVKASWKNTWENDRFLLEAPE